MSERPLEPSFEPGGRIWGGARGRAQAGPTGLDVLTDNRSRRERKISLQSNFSALSRSTERFAVTISEQCCGLEGVGLMLAFCATWLWYFRREYRFPRAPIVVPAALLPTFALNVVRIAALVGAICHSFDISSSQLR